MGTKTKTKTRFTFYISQSVSFHFKKMEASNPFPCQKRVKNFPTNNDLKIYQIYELVNEFATYEGSKKFPCQVYGKNYSIEIGQISANVFQIFLDMKSNKKPSVIGDVIYPEDFADIKVEPEDVIPQEEVNQHLEQKLMEEPIEIKNESIYPEDSMDIILTEEPIEIKTESSFEATNESGAEEVKETVKLAEFRELTKKSRKSYTVLQKAEVVDDYFAKKADDGRLSLAVYAKQIGVSKSMLSRWIQDKDIFQKAIEDQNCHFRKGSVSIKHSMTFPLLHEEFVKMRQTGRNISLDWFWHKGRKIAKEIEAPQFTKSAVRLFLKKYCIKTRNLPRKKQDAKA